MGVRTGIEVDRVECDRIRCGVGIARHRGSGVGVEGWGVGVEVWGFPFCIAREKNKTKYITK